MPERLLEYAAMLHRSLVAGGAQGSNGVVPACVSVVVYNGREQWTPPLTVQERTAWAPPALAAWQPRFAYRLNEGLQRGRTEGLEHGREEERQLLRSQVVRRFGEATAEAV